MDLHSLETSIVQFTPEMGTDTLLDLGDKIAAAGELVKEVKRRWEAEMISRIDRDGPIQCGEILYRVGEPPKTTCLDLPGAVEAVLTHVGGDFGTFCEHLSSGALKHGACKATLPEDVYGLLFKVEREKELQSDPATPRRLAKLNLAFVRA